MNALTKIIITCAVVLTSATAGAADPIVTESTSTSTARSVSESTTTVYSPPPSAIAPAITSINNDLCIVGASGAVQTQILGMSFGTTTTDKNCERLKLSKTLYDMGMKVAAVATMCQDERVFSAMMMAGTPCPFNGKIGEEARELWAANPDRQPRSETVPVVTKEKSSAASIIRVR